MARTIDEQRWIVTVRRLGGDAAAPAASDLDGASARTMAWVAVEAPSAPDEVGGDLEPVPIDPDVQTVAAAVDRLLARTARPWVGRAVEAAIDDLDPPPAQGWAGAHVARLAHAVVAALVAGHVTAGGTWNIHVDDSVGVAIAALPAVMDLIGGFADGWDPTIAPSTVATNHGSFERSGSGYRAVSGRLTTVPDVWIRLEHDRGPDDPLPDVLDAPAVVVRPAPAAVDTGPPPPPGRPPHPEPPALAAARWCFGTADPSPEMLGEVAGLFDGTWPALPTPAEVHHDEAWRLRDVAELLLDAWPHEPVALCFRARVEAMSASGRRERMAALVDRAMATARSTPSALDPIRRLAGALRTPGRQEWLADVWTAAERHGVAIREMEVDVLDHPDRSDGAELGLVLAHRLERVRLTTAGLRSGKDGEG